LTIAAQPRRRLASEVGVQPEAGRVRGTIQKNVTSEIVFNGYKRHASKDEPQYIIKSDETDHLAIHKGSALKKIQEANAIATARDCRAGGDERDYRHALDSRFSPIAE
jgi:hypothetical protein